MTATWFHDQATDAITRAAWAITFFGSVGFLTGSSIAVALFLLWRRCWHWLLASVLAMTGASLLGLLLKHMFQCQRPLLENSLVTLSSYDFPSGHILGGTLFFGILALFVGSEIVRRWPRRVLCFLSALLVVLLIGLSRI